jgi:hypothetical protein
MLLSGEEQGRGLPSLIIALAERMNSAAGAWREVQMQQVTTYADVC